MSVINTEFHKIHSVPSLTR